MMCSLRLNLQIRTASSTLDLTHSLHLLNYSFRFPSFAGKLSYINIQFGATFVGYVWVWPAAVPSDGQFWPASSFCSHSPAWNGKNFPVLLPRANKSSNLIIPSAADSRQLMESVDWKIVCRLPRRIMLSRAPTRTSAQMAAPTPSTTSPTRTGIELSATTYRNSRTPLCPR